MFKNIFIVLLVILVGLMLALPVFAAPAIQDAGIDAPGFDAFAGTLDALFGLVPIVAIAAPLLSTLVNAGKRYGLIADGQAGLYSGGLNLIVWIAVGVATQLGYEQQANTVIEGLGLIAPVVLGFVASILATKGAYHLSDLTGTALKRPPRDLAARELGYEGSLPIKQ